MRIDVAGGPSIGGTPFSVKQIGVRQFRGISSASAEPLYIPPAGTVETSACNFVAPPCAIGPEFLWKRVQHTRGGYADDHSLLRRIFGGSERNGSMHSQHPQLEQHSGRLASRWRCRRQLNLRHDRRERLVHSAKGSACQQYRHHHGNCHAQTTLTATASV